MNREQFNTAQKKFESYDLRCLNPELSVETAYDIIIAEKVRAERDAYLLATDYRMVSDAPWDRDVWATYRQQLRDLPNTEGFPHAITWPTEPS